MSAVPKILATLFHPLLITTYGTAAYVFIIRRIDFLAAGNVNWLILGLIFASTFLLPLISVFIMYRFGMIGTMQMHTAKERNWPLIQSTVIYLVALFAMNTRIIPTFIQLLTLTAAVCMLEALIINLWWKISLHMIGIGGLCGALIITARNDSKVPLGLLSAVFVIAGIIGTARMIIGAHNIAQITAGFLLGIVSALVLFTLAG